MKFLKDLDIEQLKIDSLVDCTKMKKINLEEELKNIMEQEVEKLYKKYVPKDVRDVNDFKLQESSKEKLSKPSPKKATPSGESLPQPKVNGSEHFQK